LLSTVVNRGRGLLQTVDMAAIDLFFTQSSFSFSL
jgi:hypothetical protein